MWWWWWWWWLSCSGGDLSDIGDPIADKITSIYPCLLQGHCNHSVAISLIIPSSLGDLPCLMSTGEESSSYSSRRRNPDASSCYSLASAKTTISPRKRSRTSRVQHIQRPCLDFEKMQQVGSSTNNLDLFYLMTIAR